MQQYEHADLKLASEIAERLGDKESLPLYLSFVRKYNEEHLRKILERVMSIPESQIRKTRGALFTFIVNNHYAYAEHIRD